MFYPFLNTPYEISAEGIVRHHDSGMNYHHHILQPHVVRGYYRYNLWVDNKTKCYYLHRMLALTFIPNPTNLPAINHIDGNKLNNNLSNLEWISNRDNILHAHRLGLNSTAAAVHSRSKNLIINGIEYPSLTAAGKALGVSRQTISRRFC